MNKTSYPIVELKGYRDGLHLIIDPAVAMTTVESALKDRMANLGDSLSGMEVSVDIGSRSLSQQEEGRLKSLLDRDYGLEVKQFIDQSNRTTQREVDVRILGAPSAHQEEDLVNNHLRPDGEYIRYLRHTLRSGQMERTLDGSIFILGDVNPGAEVIAARDIIVLGALRGIAHAGALGDTSSVIIALNLLPTQLRIGGFITRPPSEKQQPQGRVEIARVKEDRIIVEAFKGL